MIILIPINKSDDYLLLVYNHCPWLWDAQDNFRQWLGLAKYWFMAAQCAQQKLFRIVGCIKLYPLYCWLHLSFSCLSYWSRTTIENRRFDSTTKGWSSDRCTSQSPASVSTMNCPQPLRRKIKATWLRKSQQCDVDHKFIISQSRIGQTENWLW